MKNWTRRENEASVHMLPLQTFLLKTCFTLWFCTAMVSGGLCRNNHQSGIIPDHSIPVSSHHPPFKRSQKRKWRMILAEIRGNFLWKGEQNYLGLKHGRAINSSVLGRKAPKSFISSCEDFGFASNPNYVLVAEWGCSVWAVRCKVCGPEPIAQKKMLSSDQPVPFLFFSHCMSIFLTDFISKYMPCLLCDILQNFSQEVTRPETGLP